jgi:hypothetical protein
MTSPAPRAETVLQMWERGRCEHPVDRALTMLSLLSGRPRDELAGMSIERRDGQLLAWRATIFGSQLPGYARCPDCGCGVDVALSVPAEDDIEESFTVEVSGQTVAARLPTSLDLAAMATSGSVGEASRALVARCTGDGAAMPDPQIARAVEAEWDRRATLSAGSVSLGCPDCDRQWALDVDVAEFLWREIEIHVVRLLQEVDLLARRYGWSERDILALSTTRRRLYLGLAS